MYWTTDNQVLANTTVKKFYCCNFVIIQNPYCRLHLHGCVCHCFAPLRKLFFNVLVTVTNEMKNIIKRRNKRKQKRKTNLNDSWFCPFLGIVWGSFSYNNIKFAYTFDSLTFLTPWLKSSVSSFHTEMPNFFFKSWESLCFDWRTCFNVWISSSI